MRKFSLFVVALLLLAVSIMPAAAQQGTIVDIAAGNDDFSILVQAVQAADPAIAEALSGPGPLTVFAPTNRAFNNLASFLGVSLDELLANQDVVTQLLQYHVIQGNVFSSQIVTDAPIGETRLFPTLLPNTAIGVVVNEDNSIVLNGIVNVTAADIAASNGVVHVIDNVLLHSSITAQLEAPTDAPAVEEPTDEVMAEDNVFVRVAHLSPDAPDVDVYVNGEVALSGVPFGEISDWLTLPSGRYDVAVAPAGTSIDDAVIGPSEFGLIDGWFTVAALGSVTDGTLSVVTLTGAPSPDDDGDARVTVFHTIEDAPSVDIITDDGTVIISDLAYTQFETIDVPAGTYDLAVVPTGETEPVVIDLSGTALDAGANYLVSAIGTLEDPNVAVAVTDADAIASLTATEEEADVAEGETIADIVVASDDFSLLLAVVLAADPAILDALAGPGPLTVFAPTDQAFENLIATLGISLDEALMFSDLLTQVLLYHVVSGEVFAADVVELDGTSVPTLLDDAAFLVEVTDDGVVLNEIVNVTATDIQASNGVIHVIDNVLLPQVVLDQLAALGVLGN